MWRRVHNIYVGINCVPLSVRKRQLLGTPCEAIRFIVARMCHSSTLSGHGLPKSCFLLRENGLISIKMATLVVGRISIVFFDSSTRQVQTNLDIRGRIWCAKYRSSDLQILNSFIPKRKYYSENYSLTTFLSCRENYHRLYPFIRCNV